MKYVIDGFDETVDWRVSPANIKWMELMVDRQTKAGLTESAEHLKRVVDAMKRASSAGKPLARFEDRPKARTEPSTNPVMGEVYFLTDNECASACLDLADLMRRLPHVTHVGLPTSADAIYIDNTNADLPSGLGVLGYSLKVYRNRVRGNNEWYEPKVRWPGGAMTEEALVNWILSLSTNDKRMRFGEIIKALAIIFLLGSFSCAQQKPRMANNEELYALARTDLKAFAHGVSRDATSELGRAQAIVRWLAKNFEWKATDYQKRTVAEIIERRGGNCNELAMVALAAMKELDIKLRRVHEVNIYTNTPERGMRAREMVKEKGNAYSVFGRHHNDHVWLELFDSAANEWFPADPSSGLVGTKEWLKGRVWFGKRVTLNPITEDMIVPFAIFAADENGKFTVNRTQHYLVEEFDRLYSGKLHRQALWKEWTSSLDLLDDKVAGAFAGNINLHEYESQIDSLAATYEQLRRTLQKK